MYSVFGRKPYFLDGVEDFLGEIKETCEVNKIVDDFYLKGYDEFNIYSIDNGDIIKRLQSEAYEQYVISWQAEHDEGEPACFNEFCDCEFCEDECMKTLLTEQQYKVWDTLMYKNSQ